MIKKAKAFDSILEICLNTDHEIAMERDARSGFWSIEDNNGHCEICGEPLEGGSSAWYCRKCLDKTFRFMRKGPELFDQKIDWTTFSSIATEVLDRIDSEELRNFLIKNMKGGEMTKHGGIVSDR